MNSIISQGMHGATVVMNTIIPINPIKHKHQPHVKSSIRSRLQTHSHLRRLQIGNQDLSEGYLIWWLNDKPTKSHIPFRCFKYCFSKNHCTSDSGLAIFLFHTHTYSLTILCLPSHESKLVTVCLISATLIICTQHQLAGRQFTSLFALVEATLDFNSSSRGRASIERNI